MLGGSIQKDVNGETVRFKVDREKRLAFRIRELRKLGRL